MATPFVYLTRRLPEVALARLRAALPDARVEVNPAPRALTAEELVANARGADAVISTLVDRIDAAFFDALAPQLRVLATFAVGYENIDMEAARAHGVLVTHTPGVLTEATAEIAVSLMLACARRTGEAERSVRGGDFAPFDPTARLGRSVYGKTVGIVGAGRIGRRVAETMRYGFDCEVLIYSRSSQPDWEQTVGAEVVSLDTLLGRSDFVSLHCPATPETRHLIDRDALARMPSHACLVNTSRGASVDEVALAEALESGAIAAAGLDVYEAEPRVTPALLALENTVLLPHIGSATREARDGMAILCAEAVIAGLAGKPVAHPIA